MNLENYNIELNTDIKFLKGVGPQRSKVLNANNIFTIEDIIKYYPRKYLDRTNIKNISDLIIGEKAVCIVVVKSFAIKQTRKGKYFQLTIHDKTGYLNCLWFRGVSWIIEKFNVGDKVAIFGKVEFYQGLRIIHPEFDILDDVDDPINTGCIVPMYASNLQLKNVGLDSRGIRKIIINALNLLKSEIKDYFNLNHRKEEALLSLQEALYSIHVPKDQFQINSL